MERNNDILRQSKIGKVPYMGCQSLKYHNRISNHRTSQLDEGSPTNTLANENDISHHKKPRGGPVPTAILIHQNSPQSIRSFSTCRSDNTVKYENSEKSDDKSDDRSITNVAIEPTTVAIVTRQLSNQSDTDYDIPPIETSEILNEYQLDSTDAIDFIPDLNQSRHINEQHQPQHSTLRVRKKPSLLKKLPYREDKSKNDNNNISKPTRFLCVGMRTPHSALNKSLDSLPEAEHLKANLEPLELKNTKFSFLNGQTNNYKTNNSSLFVIFQTDKDMKWSRNSLKRPILDIVPKSQWKHSVKCFKTIQKYMGDRKTRKSPSNLVSLIHKVTIKEPVLYDEVIAQICRQTIDNPDKLSQSRGLELLAECLEHFRLSQNIISYLRRFISENLIITSKSYSYLRDSQQTVYPQVQQHLERCENLLYQKYPQSRNQSTNESPKSPTNRMTLSSVSYRSQPYSHQRKYSLTHSDQMSSGFEHKVSFFNRDLQLQMEIQNYKFPKVTVPIILTTVCNQIVDAMEPHADFMSFYRNSQCERSVITNATIDIDRWCVCTCQGVIANVPNLHDLGLAVLGHWLLSLPNPLLNSITDLSSIPATNKTILFYIVDFFKEYVTDRNKDTPANMSSFLCPLFYQFPTNQFYPHTMNQQNGDAFSDNDYEDYINLILSVFYHVSI